MPEMLSRLFRAHGRFCASHPWEVIVATLTLTICMLSVGHNSEKVVVRVPANATAANACQWQHNCLGPEEHNAVDIIFMTIIRCAALLYCYHQFRTLHKMGSKYILGIAGLFAVFSSFIFTSTVINLLQGHFTDLRDALFFFLLLTDLSKASILARFALSSLSQKEVEENIAEGMAVLGPTLTLDTVVETLVIGIGTLSGVKRLEILCTFACMSAVVNYIVFMTFYPACLSLILELSERRERKQEGIKSLVHRLQEEEEQKSNPVVQRVKVIMAAGLTLVHAHSRWPILTGRESEDNLEFGEASVWTVDVKMGSNATQESELHNYIMRWLAGSADRIVILILLFALAIKYVLFEDKEELAEQLMQSQSKSQLTVVPTLLLNDAPCKAGPPSPPVLPDPSRSMPQLVRRNRKQSPGRREKGDGNSSAKFIIGGDDGSDGEQQSGDERRSIPPSERTPQSSAPNSDAESESSGPRPLEECIQIYKSEDGASSLSDTEVINLVSNKHVPAYQLEKAVCDPERGVRIRRKMLGDSAGFHGVLGGLPYKDYDYSKVLGACCENVIGFMPIPVGVAGPLLLDGEVYYVPMATTEGCLVASTNRGCRALMAKGVQSRVTADGMTRGPVVRFPSMSQASAALKWMEVAANFASLKATFDSTSRFARLQRVTSRVAGRYLYIRFVAQTGDAMGMNMLSKGTEKALACLQTQFPDMDIVSLSGNFCTDKKPAAVNWIEGRGKSVVCEAIVPGPVVESLMKTTVEALIELNTAKNLVGSAMAGSVGGCNAHAANLVTAVYLATGQDPAQNVGSSNCITLMEATGKDKQDLYISCTMPSLEIGTVGGGTILPAQAACLDMLGVKGAHPECPGQNACTLARIICGTVLAGELSLMSALAAGHLVRSHLKHNRSTQNMEAQPVQPRESKISHLLAAAPECRPT